MTFSTRSVCDAVRETFTPVWEAVSPTTVAEFQLDEAESITGTIGGEIMLYFCRPDGVVFDALPALQSPGVVKQAIARASRFWNESNGAPDEAIREYNERRVEQIGLSQGLTPERAKERVARAHREMNRRLGSGPPATDALTTSAFSKTLMVAPAEDITVVEPGGLWLYGMQVHDQLAKGPLQSPLQWKHVMFEGILDQKLGGGHQVYDPDSLQPMQVFPPSTGVQEADLGGRR